MISWPAAMLLSSNEHLVRTQQHQTARTAILVISGAQHASSAGGGYLSMASIIKLSEGPLGGALGVCTAGGGAVCPVPVLDRCPVRFRVI